MAFNFKEWMEETEAAKLANSMEWQHGSDADFKTFDDTKIGSRTDPGFFGAGHYFVQKHTGIAPRWGKVVHNVKSSVKNPLLVSGITEYVGLAKQPTVAELRKKNPKLTEKEAYKIAVGIATANLRNAGYDSVLWKKDDGTYQLIVFDAKNINIQ